MNRAGALIRVSTSKQLEGTSPEKQKELIRELATDHGYELHDRHAWLVAESGAKRERIGFREALTAASEGDVSRIYVYSVDRLGRDLLEMLLFLRDLDDQNVECWEAENRRRLRWNDFMLQIEGAVAGKERQEIIRRTQDGLRRAIKAGKYSGGIIAYGYRLNSETKQLEIDDEEATIIRMIFEWCVDERLSCVKIAGRLNAMAIPTRYTKDGRKARRPGKRTAEKTAGIWRAGRVRNMLKNPAYMGKWEYGKRSKKRRPGDRIPGYCPAIVSSESFYQASDVLQQNQLVAPEHARRQYLLRGLIKCGVCGLAYCGTAWKVGPGRSKEKVYYACNGATQWRKLGKPKCPGKSVNGNTLEAVVWEDIKAFILKPEVAIDQLRAQRRPEDETLGERIADAEDQIAELQRRERNLLRVAAESEEVDPQALDDVLREIRDSIASLNAYKTHLEERNERGEALEKELIGVATRLAALRSQIDVASFHEKRRAVVELVKGIEVELEIIGGKKTAIVTITYRFDEPGSAAPPLQRRSTQIVDRTPAPAGTSETRSRNAHAILQR